MWINRILLVILIIVILILAGVIYHQLDAVKKKQDFNSIENVRTNHLLLSTIDWSTQRQKTILYMRDVIICEWGVLGKKPDYDKAYLKSEAIMRECERYPKVDPLAMLAVQRVESRFQDSLVSPMNARGCWQFITSTAHLLCQALGITYSERIYTDPILGTRLAGKYFDVLYASYPDSQELARYADYNGGPQQASFFLFNKSRLSEETKNFVRNVQKYKLEYHKGFTDYEPIRKDGKK